VTWQPVAADAKVGTTIAVVAAATMSAESKAAGRRFPCNTMTPHT